nr:General stress protein 39 [Klebsiella pneumoniae]
MLQSSGGQPDEKVKQFGKDTPMGRPGQPVEIARCMSPGIRCLLIYLRTGVVL